MRKKILSFFVVLTMIIPFLGLTKNVDATYAPTRVISGTPFTLDALTVYSKEGGAYYRTPGFRGESYLDGNSYVYEGEYEVAPNSEIVFNTKYIATPNNFWNSRSFQVHDLNSLPTNLANNLKIIEYTKTKFSFRYTFSDEEVDWTKDSAQSKTPIMALSPVWSFNKLPDNVEANYGCINYETKVLKDGEQILGSSETSSHHIIDKKNVEIKEEVGAVPSDGSAIVYNSDPNVTTYLDNEQEAEIKLTLTRPTGITASSDIEVTGNIPDGMTYVDGSLSATSSNGLAVTTDDSSGTPIISFSNLPVGETITCTYRVKAPTTNEPTKFNTNDVLVNLYQKNLFSSGASVYDKTNMYTEDEATTTCSLPLQMNGKYNVKFDPNGGTGTYPDVTVKGGMQVSKPETIPTKKAKYGPATFDGWYLGDTKYDFSTPVRDNITLVAHYKEPNIITSVSADKTTVNPGDKLTYTINVTNNGYGNSYDGEVTFTIPKGLTVVDLDGGKLSPDRKTIIYKYNPLDAGKSQLFKPIFEVPQDAKNNSSYNASVQVTSINGEDITGEPVSKIITPVVKNNSVSTGDNNHWELFFLFGGSALMILRSLTKKRKAK
ncbi:MAG: InlB B-repeat-containing protein [Thomasclavelia sp.]|jgi:uncharacterized repeat protein (TIGR01451 family)|nr:InlB B-repeat-containing protein [Thomasclavelia sp.]